MRRDGSSGGVTLTPGTALKIHGRPVASGSGPREFFQCHCGTQVDGSMSQVRTSPRHWSSSAHQSLSAYRYNKRQTWIAAHNLRTCRLHDRRLLHDRNSRRLPTQPLGKKTRKKPGKWPLIKGGGGAECRRVGHARLQSGGCPPGPAAAPAAASRRRHQWQRSAGGVGR
jgi:hypothetical protein